MRKENTKFSKINKILIYILLFLNLFLLVKIVVQFNELKEDVRMLNRSVSINDLNSDLYVSKSDLINMILYANYIKSEYSFYSYDYISNIVVLCYNISKEYDLNTSLVIAVIQVESDFDMTAVSSCGARGLMQLMYTTAQLYHDEQLNEQQLFDIELNIRTGCKHLKYLISRYGEKDGIARYYAGRYYKENYDYYYKVKEIEYRIENYFNMHKDDAVLCYNTCDDKKKK